MRDFFASTVVAVLCCIFPQLILAIPPPPHSLADPNYDNGWNELSDLPAGRAVGNPIPLTGDQKLLIVLVDFPDREGLFTGEAWHEAFFGSRQFADYFREVSYDQLRYTGTVVGIHDGSPVENSPEVAYIRLPHDITYYADGNRGFSIGNFPQNNMGVADHAAQALDDAGFDFGPYADENDMVQNFLVVYAGIATVYTGNVDESLEATAYRISYSKQVPFVSKDGYIIDNYTFCPEQRFSLTFGGLESNEIAYQGICVHEHGHALSMPDLYDYSFTTTGVGEFDLMGYGTYGGDETGRNPFHLGAFSKMFFGWTEPAVYGEGTHEVTLQPAETHADMIMLYPGGDEDATEYYLLENRQLIGFDEEWDMLPGLCAGLVIWHIDGGQVSNLGRFFRINSQGASDPQNPGISVVEADGGSDLVSSPLNFGDCEDIWQVGETWANDLLFDGSDTHLSVKVVESTADNSLVLELVVGEDTDDTAGSADDSAPEAEESCNFICGIIGAVTSVFDLLFGWVFELF